MRKCDNCGKEIPFGSDIIEVRVFGSTNNEWDFCSALCFEKFYSQTRYKLLLKPKEKEAQL